MRNLKTLLLQKNLNLRFYEEIRIPVPWGHISGKWWGPKDKQPILCIHGWKDNCGSFDKLIPRLPQNMSYLAIDLPGQGHSSWLPKGMFYHIMDVPILIRQLTDFFKWKKVSLMAHSLGGMMAFYYASLYPQTVDLAIFLDGMFPYLHPKKSERYRKSIEEFLKYDQISCDENEPPSYTLEELQKRTADIIQSDIESCNALLERHIVPSKKQLGKYYVNTDPRLKVGPLVNWPVDEIEENITKLDFPILLIRPDISIFRKSKFDRYIEIAKNTNPNFNCHHVLGNHFVHLNSPQTIDTVISDFIKRHHIEYGSNVDLEEEKNKNQMYAF